MNKLLVIDDHPIICQGIIRIAERAFPGKWRLFEAHSAQAALIIARSERPDALITDICLPDMSGLEMINRLQNSSLSAHYVVISGYNEFDYARAALKLGVLDYLLKPIDREQVETLLKRLLVMLGTTAHEPALDEETNAQIQWAIEYINAHYMDDISLSHISNLASKNYSYFSTLFKKCTGKSYSHYLRFVRIEEAKRLLCDPYISINTVCRRVGVADISYFYRLFQQSTNMTPKQYQDMHARKPK